jgi:hypothetical protein
MPQKTMTKGASRPAAGSRACAAMSTAIRSCGSPPPEKIGSFWPRTRLFIRSIAVNPVSMNARGVARAAGFSGRPSTRSRRSAATGGPPSITCPTPSNTRPSNPGPTPNSIGLPRKRTTVSASPRPALGSSISMVTSDSSSAAMRPRRALPSRSITSTASPSPTSSVRRTNSSGPSSRTAASCTVMREVTTTAPARAAAPAAPARTPRTRPPRATAARQSRPAWRAVRRPCARRRSPRPCGPAVAPHRARTPPRAWRRDRPRPRPAR